MGKSFVHIFLLVALAFSSKSIISQKYFPITENGKWTIIDDQGNKVLDKTYSYVSIFRNGFAAIKKDGVWGVVSESNEERFFREYAELKALDKIQHNNKAFFAARKEDGYGLIDLNNNQFTDFNFSNFEVHGDYFIAKRKDNTLEFGHMKLGWITSSYFREIRFEDFIFVTMDQQGKRVVYDTAGTILYKDNFHQCIKVKNVIIMKYHNQVKLININGDVLVESVSSLKILDPQVIVGTNLKESRGFRISNVDAEPQVVYEEFQASWLNYHIFKREGNLSIVDSTFNVVIDEKYAYYNRFDSFLLLSKEDRNFTVFNRDLERIVSDNVDYLKPFERENWFLFRQNGEFGILTQSGVILPAEYNFFRIQNEKIFAYKDNTLTIFEINGDEISLEQKFNNFVSVYAFSDISSIKGESADFSDSLQSQRNDWFTDTIKRGNPSKTYTRWGVRNPVDTAEIYLEAKYLLMNSYNQRFDLAKRRHGDWSDDIFYGFEFDIYDRDLKQIINEEPILNLRRYTGFRRQGFYIARGRNNFYILNDTLQVKHRNIGYIQLNQFDKLMPFSTSGTGQSFFPNKTDVKWPILLNDWVSNYDANLRSLRLNGTMSTKQYKEYTARLISNYTKFNNSQWGYINHSGDIVIKANYDFVDPLHTSMAIVYKDGKQGVINQHGEVIPPSYPKVYFIPFENDSVIMTLDHRVSSHDYIDSIGNVRTFPYNVVINSVFNDGKHFITFKKNGKFGLLDLDGNEVFPPISSREPIVKENYVIVKERKSGVIDFEGNYIIDPVYSKIESFKNDRVVHKYKGKYGVGDFSGEEVIPPVFREIILRENTILAKNGNLRIVYDYSGNQLNKDKWYFADFNEELNLWLYNKRGKQFIHDNNTGRKKRIRQGNGKASFCGNYILIEHNARQKNLYEYSSKMKPLFSNNYNDITPFDEHTFKIWGNRRFGLANNKGVVLFPPNYREIEEVFEDVYAGIYKLEFIAVNVHGDTLFSRRCDQMMKCANGTLMLKDDNRVIFLDSNFVNVYNKVYDDAHCVSERIAPVKIDGFWGLMNEENELMFEPCYKSVRPVGNNLFYAESKARYGLYLKSGEEIAEPVFERIEKINEDILMVVNSGLIGYIYKTGEWMYNPFQNLTVSKN